MRKLNGTEAFALAALALGLFLPAPPAGAQELTPRAYWPSPKGLNVAVAGFTFSEGDIVTDPTLPIERSDSRGLFLSAGYQRTFGLAGRSASLLVSVPYVWSNSKVDLSDVIEGVFTERRVSDFGDLRLRLAVNLIGAPAMDPAEFQGMSKNPRPILGASVQLSAPTGGYDSDRVINAGTNRWAAKADLGYIHPVKPTWQLEFSLGMWFFGGNDEFVGFKRRQDPIRAFEAHIVKLFRPGFWVSFEGNFYAGGQSSFGEIEGAARQRNVRIGSTVAYPLGGGHGIKATLSDSILTEASGDFSAAQVTYTFAWR